MIDPTSNSISKFKYKTIIPDSYKHDYIKKNEVNSNNDKVNHNSYNVNSSYLDENERKESSYSETSPNVANSKFLKQAIMKDSNKKTFDTDEEDEAVKKKIETAARRFSKPLVSSHYEDPQQQTISISALKLFTNVSETVTKLLIDNQNCLNELKIHKKQRMDSKTGMNFYVENNKNLLQTKPLWRHRAEGNFKPPQHLILKGKKLLRAILHAIVFLSIRPFIRIKNRRKIEIEKKKKEFKKSINVFSEFCHEWIGKMIQLPIISIIQVFIYFLFIYFFCLFSVCIRYIIFTKFFFFLEKNKKQ
jgi:hypothetical protein